MVGLLDLQVLWCSLSKPPNEKNCLVVSLLSMPQNACPELGRDLSQFFASCNLDDFFYTGHPELTILGVEGFRKAIANNSEKVATLKSKGA